MPFQIIDPAILSVIHREARKQRLSLLRASEQHLKELANIAQSIQHKGLPDYLVCKKLPKGLGHGIFLHPEAEPLSKGQVVAPYTGDTLLVPQHVADDALYAFEPLSNICLTREEQKKFHPKGKYHPRRHYSLHIDAEKSGNFTRFINHSEKPNVAAELVRIPPNSYGITESPLAVIYFISKTVHPGEQLLVSYDGDDHSYWSALDIKPFPLFAKTFYLQAGKKGLQSR
ncbi:MAG: SET domain-containing protein [Verrucomicrobia bacterium]|nr:SET domain-containing protein [Verrucomicrobiota bacterium]